MALFYQKGTISDMTEVQSGKTQSGYNWRNVSVTLDIPGFQGAVTKLVFRASGEKVEDVLKFKVGDKVQVGFTLYAREWNNRLFNNVDLVTITDENGAVKSATEIQDNLNPAENPNDLPF